ncbi:MAG: tetratricopeptide repeat protein [Beijerinckiaceae bacterium]
MPKPIQHVLSAEPERHIVPSIRVLMLGAAVLATVSVGGCAKVRAMRASTADVTGSIAQTTAQMPQGEAEIRQNLAKWDARYKRNPNDKYIARSFARALRMVRRAEQAVAVLQKAVIRHPKDINLLADYGKALADAGRFQEASQVLERAQLPETPNWSILNVQGSVADQLGQQALAQDYYRQALKIAPSEPRILSNLGLSYALSKDLPKAEQVLRQAAAHPRSDTRVLQNLSLVLALQGKFDEAENLQRQVLPASDAAANIASIRRMIAQSNTWREISKLDAENRSRRTGRKPHG